MTNPFNSISQISYRQGTILDPYVEYLTEVHTITNNVIELLEIPDRFNHVKITDMYEIYVNDITTNTNFYVDYVAGLVYFHTDLEGTSVSVHYFGRGIRLRGYGY
jgi:hypothetical protein